jgi:hypothetical protein
LPAGRRAGPICHFNFFGVINVGVEAELAKLDGGGWRPLRAAQLQDLGLA